MMVKSRIPEIVLELALKLDAVGEATAESIADGARARVPVGAPDGHLKDAIRVKEGQGVGEFQVLAGDGDTFYGHIVEHGSVHSAPRPFLVPAAEEARAKINTLARAALRTL